jgi:hypothetical protein
MAVLVLFALVVVVTLGYTSAVRGRIAEQHRQ